MKVLTIRRQVHSGKLAVELARVPGLEPVQPAGSVWPVSAFSLTTEGGVTRLLVPDAVNEAAVLAVIAAHDETPPSRQPTPRGVALSALRGAATPAEVAQAVVNYLETRQD